MARLVINATVELPLLPVDGALGLRVPVVDNASGRLDLTRLLMYLQYSAKIASMRVISKELTP